MIEVEIVVAGGLGELAMSLWPELQAERRLFTRLLAADQAAAGAILERLGAAGLEVTRVARIGSPGGDLSSETDR